MNDNLTKRLGHGGNDGMKWKPEVNRAFSADVVLGSTNPGALPQVRHGEWSRRDASDMDGLSRGAEGSRSE